ncbi:MAG TPA: O-antigen polymerase [Gemmatimonadales bacterium]|nr:O-antigen polymerase [Gemmatimonadales bacterium]
MNPVLALAAGAAGSVVGWAIHQRWFNPVTAYSAIWGMVLALTTSGLIHYYPISGAAWGYIALAWIQLTLGSAAMSGLAYRLQPLASPPRADSMPSDRRLVTAIVVLTTLAAIALGAELAVALRGSSNLTEALLKQMNARYIARVQGEEGGVIPYLGSVAFTACALAGVLTRRIRRLAAINAIPLIVVSIQGVLTAGRTGVGIAAALFVAGLAFAPPAPQELQRRSRRISTAIGLVVVLMVAAGGFTLVSANRGLVVDLPGVDPRLSSTSRHVPFLPSVVAHLSVSPPVFSEYLKAGAPAMPFPGAYTFAPFARVLSRVGIGSPVAYYEESYFTPVEANVGTWLKNWYADFGPAGVALMPFVFGLVIAYLMARLRRGNCAGATCVLVLSHLMAVIMMSFTFNIMVLGDWWVSLITAAVVGAILGKPRASSAVSAGPAVS